MPITMALPMFSKCTLAPTRWTRPAHRRITTVTACRTRLIPTGMVTVPPINRTYSPKIRRNGPTLMAMVSETIATRTRDNDGFDNDTELKAGSNDLDPLDRPADLDQDGLADVVDPDIDGDGVLNGKDAFSHNPLEWSDVDRDGIGDNADPDGDNDGIINRYELQLSFNPFDADSVPADLDSDGIPDSLDTDIDGDGFGNAIDRFPLSIRPNGQISMVISVVITVIPTGIGDGISNQHELLSGTNPADALSVPPDLDADGISGPAR